MSKKENTRAAHNEIINMMTKYITCRIYNNVYIILKYLHRMDSTRIPKAMRWSENPNVGSYRVITSQLAACEVSSQADSIVHITW